MPSPAAPGSRHAARRQASRRAILDAAEQIILEGGFPTLKTKTLVERSGVSERTIFNHFDNLDEVLLARIEQYLAPIVLEPELPSGEDHARLPHLIDQRIRENLASPEKQAELERFLRLGAALAPDLRDALGRHVLLCLGNIGHELWQDVTGLYPDLGTTQRMSLLIYCNNMTFGLVLGIAAAIDLEPEKPLGHVPELPGAAALVPHILWAMDEVNTGRPEL